MEHENEIRSSIVIDSMVQKTYRRLSLLRNRRLVSMEAILDTMRAELIKDDASSIPIIRLYI